MSNVIAPDAPGAWRLRLHAQLVHDDPLFPGFDTSDTDVVLTTTGKAARGCSQPGDVPAFVLLLAGLVIRRRRG